MNEAREKVRVFCAYRERSQVEAREKLQSYGLIPEAIDELLVELIQENFINEERFARAFVRGKFRIKKWGRNKIKRELYRHHLSEYVLKKAFSEIEAETYDHTLDLLLEKKLAETKLSNPFEKKRKVAYWLISRGYEPDIVWDKINDLFNGK